MKARRYGYSFFVTAAVAVSLAPNAFADGNSPRLVDRVLSLEDSAASTELPVALRDISPDVEEIGLREASIISLGEFPQGRLATKPSFIDFSKWEIGAFVGVEVFSSDFKADPDWILGINTRVPIPGIPLGEWGGWAQVTVGHVDRDIPFYYPKRSGTWYGGAIGADYTLATTELVYLRAQGGVSYSQWNNINSLDNGAAIIVGLDFGFYWIKQYTKASLTINPQLHFDGTNWVALFNFGFSYDF